MRPFLCLPIVLLTALFSAPPTQAQTIPPVKGKALDDSEVVLPKPGSQQHLILTIGFSHASGKPCSAWSKRLADDFSADSQLAIYQFAELQAAPSFIRGMILHGMRKDIPASRHSHFVPLYDHEDEWKKIVHFSGPDDAYVLFTASDGHVLWQTHGPVNDAAYADLKSAVSQSLAQKP